MRCVSPFFGSLCLASVLACDGTTTTGSGGSGVGGGGGNGGGNTTTCPTAPPAAGAECAPPPTDGGFAASAHCTWGEDPRPSCRTTALCQSDGTWVVTGPDAALCAAPPLPAACPSPPPTPATLCDDATLACWYADGDRCWCSPCQGGSEYPICQPIDPPQWACASPAAGCPATIPQAGTACTTPGLSCGPDCELEVICEDGAWAWRSGNCPICASPTTAVATPDGERKIADLRAGDLVLSLHRGEVAAVPLLRVASTPVSRHQVTRVTLSSGAVLEMSPGHPTAGGTTFGELRAGATLDSWHVVTDVARVPFEHARTYDILPDSDTGAYFAAGALVASTLAPRACIDY